MRDQGWEPIEALIERWQLGPSTGWEAIVGHERQVARLREVAALLRLHPDERARLGLRAGAGLLITGPSGTGKTLLARALATELGREVIAPPPGELDAERIPALYRALAGRPVLVILEEAERHVGPDWMAEGRRELLAALDGVARPDAGPVTIALTALAPSMLAPAAVRPGRLAPVLVLELPSAAERAEILRRAMDGLPGANAVDLGPIVERTGGWSGAELATLPSEALTRRLLGPSATLATDALLDLVAERYRLVDPLAEGAVDPAVLAIHEAGHAICAARRFGLRAVASITIGNRHGETVFRDDALEQPVDVRGLRAWAAIHLAGAVAEELVLGPGRVSAGSAVDRHRATELLVAAREATLPYDEQALGNPQGSDWLRGRRDAAVVRDAERLRREVATELACVRPALERLSAALRAAPGASLAGPALEALLRRPEAMEAGASR